MSKRATSAKVAHLEMKLEPTAPGEFTLYIHQLGVCIHRDTIKLWPELFVGADLTPEMLEALARKYGKKRSNRLIGRAELLQRVPYSIQHIMRKEKAGTFPKRVKLGARRVAWFEDEIDAFAEEQMERRKARDQGGSA